MHEASVNTILLIVFLIIRWLAQALFAPKQKFSSQLILLHSLLLLDYWCIVGLVFAFGNINLWGIVALYLILVIRFAAFYFSSPKGKNSFIHPFLNKWFDHPYLTTTLLEIFVFIFFLPYPFLIQLMLIVMSGVICGWYGHAIDMLERAETGSIKSYVGSRAFLLRVFFPTHPKLIDNKIFSYDTFSLYSWIAGFVGGIFAIAHGLSLSFIFFMPFFVWLGAAALDRFTIRRDINYPRGYSFYGGVIAVLLELVLFSYLFNWSFFAMLNVLAIFCAVSHVLGRMGCFAHGCCTGGVSEGYHSYMIAYLHPQHKINRINKTEYSYCYPSLVVEELCQALIAIACLCFRDHAALVWFISYGSVRLMLQPFRYRNHIAFYLISVALILFGIFIAFYIPSAPIPPYTKPTLFQIGFMVGVSFILGALYGLKFKKSFFQFRF